MPLINTELNRGDTGPTVRELHAQLISSGAIVETGEQDNGTFGPSTLAAVRAFRERYNLPAADSVDLPTARLMYVTSRLATSNDRATLSAAVKEAASAADASQPEESYWLARYAVIAGDYQTAQTVARRIPDHTGVKAVIDPILALPSHLASDPNQPPSAPPPRPPEVPYPENFYTYRRPWVDPDAVARVAANWHNLTPAEASDAQRAGGASALAALQHWQTGNTQAFARRYAAAIAAYDACQDAVLGYFDGFYPDISLRGAGRRERLSSLIRALYSLSGSRVTLWSFVQRRRELLALAELEEHDRIDPGGAYQTALTFVTQQLGTPVLPQDDLGRRRERNLDAPLMTLAFVLVPLARAEANRARRQYDAAVRDLQSVLQSWIVRTIPPPMGEGGPLRQIRMRLTNEFIEVPFAKLLLAETLLDRSDAEYKARTVAAPAPAPDVTAYQGLKAAQTCLEIKDAFAKDGAYVARVDAARDALSQQIQDRIAHEDTRSPAFRQLGSGIYVRTLTSSSTTLPGLDRRARAHEPLLRFTAPPLPEAPDAPAVLRESNPRVFAVLLSAAARLQQLEAGFNYLGYSDSHVPPWRFQFLVERARYFAEHAKNAQRDYLNFLANAEREEFQELSASQNVDMEKSNVRIETARVDLVRRELASAEESRQLALLTAKNAEARLEHYAAFDEYVDRLFDTAALRTLSDPGELILGLPGVNMLPLPRPRDIPWVGAIGTMVTDFWGRGQASQLKEKVAADAQRDHERFSLGLAADEALAAATVAKRHLEVARASLNVTALQRQAALLRHEHALQNLEFLRNRVLNAEQWFRLAAGIRSISEAYLRNSVELAFLAEQAYEFEADRRINVIRFDYDLSDVGDFLAADFLLRDLDTLEHDLVVTQRQRQQQVRYVLSMAREYPAALDEIRDGGAATFTLSLEQLEKRLPGLYNLRIGAVDLQPVAVVDPTRFSVELTHLGTSQVRLKAQPDTPSGEASPSPLNTADVTVPAGGWLVDLIHTWPIKLRLTGPETCVFSGLSRADAAAVFPFTSASQRHAFEGLGAASAWKVDFTARDNQLVPGTLADVLITFTLSGYHDADFRRAVDTAPRPVTSVTRWLSGRTTFPDSLYELHRSGRMVWHASRDLLELTDTPGPVRNVAAVLTPKLPRTANSLGRMMSRCRLRFRITPAGELKVLTDVPRIAFEPGSTTDSLVLRARADLTDGPPATMTWDFGDSSARHEGPTAEHAYAKPGRYTVLVQAGRGGRLSEVRAEIVVSRAHGSRLVPPVTTVPSIARESGPDVPAGHIRVVGEIAESPGDPVVANWRVGEGRPATGSRVRFDLTPGEYTLVFSAVRAIKGRLFCMQRQPADGLFAFDALRLGSNRRFAVDGTETTGAGENPPATPLTTHLLSDVLSPVDEWTLELPLDANPCLRSVSSSDVEQYTLDDLEDAILTLEYETSPAVAD